MATVKKGARKAAKQSVAYQSMPVAVLAAVMGGVFVLTGILLLYVSQGNGVIYMRPLQWGIISMVIGVVGFIIALKVKPTRDGCFGTP